MRRTVCAVVLALALAGCGAPLASVAPQSSEPIVTKSQVLVLTTAVPPPADGSDIRACHDGTCEISVSRPLTIPLDGRSGFNAVTIEAIEPNLMSFRVNFPDGTALRSSTSPGGRVTFRSGTGSMTINVLTINSGTAVIKMSSV